MESSAPMINKFIKDFFVFNVELDIKCGEKNKKTSKILEDSIFLTKKDHFSDLKIDHVLKVNCGVVKKFEKKLKYKDKIVLFYNSHRHKKLFKEYEKVREYVL